MKDLKNRLFVPYYRVSSEDQGKSGLGINSQRRFVRDYCETNGTILEEFNDVFSGASAEREGLTKAIKLCKSSGAVLVAYDITRISRGGLNVRFVLETEKIEYLGALSPHDSSFSKGIKFEVAKEERERISSNTKKALNEIKIHIKENGFHISKAGNTITSLGSPNNLSSKARCNSIETRKKKAKDNINNKMAYSLIKVLRSKSKETYAAISNSLNESGFKTSRGSNFSAMQVKRVYELYTSL
jgi:DNA invertase Pin-like site-specific DNA recombinase